MNRIAHRSLLLGAAAATALLSSGCAERLQPSEFDQVSPAVNGDNVVWEDSRNDATNGTDIYTYNIQTSIEATIVAGGPGEQDQPAISDQYVVWIDEGRLMAKPLSGGSSFTVVNGAATHSDPAICGSLVVWSDIANNSDVYAKQLPSGPVIQVATSDQVEAYPACDAGRIVYMYSPTTGNSDIRLYDVGSGQTSVVSNQIWNEWRPSISGNRVVWQAWPGQPDTETGYQIYGKDLSTNQNFVVSEGTGNQQAPVISGSTVAWEDLRSGTSKIWWRDLATTMNAKPADGDEPGSQAGVSLSGRRAAFQGNGAGPWNVYITPLFFYTGT